MLRYIFIIFLFSFFSFANIPTSYNNNIHTVTIKATDISGIAMSDDVVIRVSNGTDLIADAGRDQYVELGDVDKFVKSNELY